MESNEDKVILDVYKKIEREKTLIQGAKSLRQSTDNALVQQKCDSTIRESQNNLAYLEDTMRQLKLRKRQSSSTNTASGLGEDSDHQHSSSESGLSSSPPKHSSLSSASAGNETDTLHDDLPPPVPFKGE